MASGDVDQSVLYDLFVRCYDDFNTSFQARERERGGLPATSCIIFGVTGVGKSAFLARLKSDLPPKEFAAAIRSDRVVDIEGVAVSGGQSSCTLVPKLHYVAGSRRIGVYDVPGFRDNDPNKDIVINVMHKCLLNRVKQAKFIVVLSMGQLFELRMPCVITDYHKQLRDLFGAGNYDKFLENAFFILTKNDKENRCKTEADVQDICMKTCFAMGDKATPGLITFLRRLSDHHVIIDYATQEQGEILEHLGRSFFEVQSTGIGLTTAYGAFDASENSLLRHGADSLTRRLQFFSEMHTRIRLEFQGRVESLTTERASYFETKRDLNYLRGNIVACQKEITTSQNSIMINQLTLEANRLLISEKEAMSTSFSQNKAFLESQAQSDTINAISLRQDVSVLKPESFLNKEIHTFNSIISFEAAERQRSPPLTLVVKSEHNDATLRQYMNNAGSLVPKTKRHAEQCSLDIVLYNSSSFIAKADLTHQVVYKPEKGELHITLSSPSPFKVLIYTEIPFHLTCASTALSEHFNTSYGSCQTELVLAQKARENLLKEIAKAEYSIKENNGTITTSTETEIITARELARKLPAFNLRCENVLTDIAQQSLTCEKEFVLPETVIIRRIGDICHQNELVNGLTGRIQELDKSTMAIRVALADFTSRLRALATVKDSDEK